MLPTKTCQRECARSKKTKYGVLNHAKRTLHKASDRANYVRRCWVNANECAIFHLVAKSWRRSSETNKREFGGSSKFSNCTSWFGRRGTNQTDYTLTPKLDNSLKCVISLPVRVANENFNLQNKKLRKCENVKICIGAVVTLRRNPRNESNGLRLSNLSTNLKFDSLFQ